MKIRIDKKLLRFYLWVASGYFLLWLFHTLSTYPNHFFAVFFNDLWAVMYIITVNFMLFEYSIPFVVRKRKIILVNILLAVLFLFIYLVLYSCGAYAWRLFGSQIGIYTFLKTYPDTEHAIEDYMAYSMGAVFLFGIARHIYNYVRLRQTAQQMRIANQEAELNYLRSQTNPHFLFNTLNNIYSLTRDKSDLAQEAVLRLSKLLRFMLYETKGDFISIERELKIISDYIALEKLRYDESLHVNFNYDIEDMKQALPPLLLIPLVENAFKHGASETRVNPFVDVHLSINNRQLKFLVKNSTGSVNAEPGMKENIGLSNLRRQLELLYKEYSLNIEHNNSIFTAILKINLASHV